MNGSIGFAFDSSPLQFHMWWELHGHIWKIHYPFNAFFASTFLFRFRLRHIIQVLIFSRHYQPSTQFAHSYLVVGLSCNFKQGYENKLRLTRLYIGFKKLRSNGLRKTVRKRELQGEICRAKMGTGRIPETKRGKKIGEARRGAAEDQNREKRWRRQ